VLSYFRVFVILLQTDHENTKVRKHEMKMITTRGWWFILVVLSLLTLGVFDDRRTTTLLGLTLLMWFLWQWLLFTLRVRLAIPAVQVRRELRDDRGRVESVWVGHTFGVHVEVHTSSWLRLPYVLVTDPLPVGVERTRGTNEREGVLSSEDRVSVNYSLRCSGPGQLRFAGVALEMTDFQGLLYHRAVIADPRIFRVLPPLADSRGNRPTVKRNNLLPSPGVHRHLRPGSGSELLDLRDYLPGDPPKTIAWKVSARRDRLITKEFESDVPVRCTLFVDISHSVRVGLSGHNALARLVDISAAVSQAAAAGRDLTGLCLFDDQQVRTYLRPARGKGHLVRQLNLLADAAALRPATGEARVATLLPSAYALAQELYPDLLRPDINHVPTWMPWFWSVPRYQRGSTRVRRALGGLFLALAFLPFILLLAFVAMAAYLFYPDLLAKVIPLSPSAAAACGIGAALVLTIGYYGLLRLGGRVVPLVFSPRRRRRAGWRKRLAALLSVRYELGSGGIALLLENDAEFVLYLQRFLADHQVPYPLPLYDARGRYLFASPGKVPVLAQALLRAVGKGRDNELFVLLVDLLELVDDLQLLIPAVKVALARHHQVLVLCPWPPGIPVPKKREASLDVPAPELAPSTAAAFVHQATTERLHGSFAALRQAFAQLGVPVLCAAAGDPVRLILARLNQLRAAGLGRRR
jgi:uncharacterized protein (DUF58 family)